MGGHWKKRIMNSQNRSFLFKLEFMNLYIIIEDVGFNTFKSISQVPTFNCI